MADATEVLERLPGTFEDFRRNMDDDYADMRRQGNNEGMVFFRGEKSGIGYAITEIEKELHQ